MCQGAYLTDLDTEVMIWPPGLALSLTCHCGFSWWSLNTWLNLAAVGRDELLNLLRCYRTASVWWGQLLCLPYALHSLPGAVDVSWIFHNFMWQKSMIYSVNLRHERLELCLEVVLVKTICLRHASPSKDVVSSIYPAVQALANPHCWARCTSAVLITAPAQWDRARFSIIPK